MVAATQLKVKRNGLWPFVYVDWFKEPARSRTVLVRGKPQRVDFPLVVFAVTRLFGMFLRLHAMCRDETGHLRVLYIPNVIDGQVCLGTAYESVFRGKLDPVEAFWNTSFDGVISELLRCGQHIDEWKVKRAAYKSFAELMGGILVLIIAVICALCVAVGAILLLRSLGA